MGVAEKLDNEPKSALTIKVKQNLKPKLNCETSSRLFSSEDELREDENADSRISFGKIQFHRGGDPNN